LNRNANMWSGLLIAAVGLIVYYPTLKIGFFAEDYVFLDGIIRSDFGDYWTRNFDPRVSNPIFWYRPLRALLLWIEYALFGGNAEAFHLVQVSIHVINSLLMFKLLTWVFKRWQLALVAVLAYIALPQAKEAVYWATVARPLAMIFYLLTLIFWMGHLRAGGRKKYVAALVCFGLTLLTEEIGATLPLALLWLELVLFFDRVRRNYADTFKRHLPLWIGAAIYIWFYWQRQIAAPPAAAGEAAYGGVGMGWHVLINLWKYFEIVAFPFFPSPFSGMWAMILLCILGYVMLVQKNAPLALLGGLALLNIAPALLIPNISERYLYFSALFFGGMLAYFSEFIAKQKQALAPAASVLLVALVIALGAERVAASSDALALYARQMRQTFRPVYARHAQFPPGTLVYLINSPVATDIASGMFALRYGRGVVVNGTDVPQRARLADYRHAFVYYFDEGANAPEQIANAAPTIAQLNLPVIFENKIQLEGYEVVRAQLKPGDNLIILLYWRALDLIDKDWTVFAHLVDGNNALIAGNDSPPREGKLPTSIWRQNRLIVDWIILPVPPVTGKDFRVQIGLYDLATLARARIIGAENMKTAALEIGAFVIEE